MKQHITVQNRSITKKSIKAIIIKHEQHLNELRNYKLQQLELFVTKKCKNKISTPKLEAETKRISFCRQRNHHRSQKHVKQQLELTPINKL